MARLKPVLIFLIQSVVVGLAAAFVVVLVRPQLLPAIDIGAGIVTGQPASYADAVDIAAPAVANVYTRRLMPNTGPGGSGRFRVNTSVGSAVVIDAEGYLVTNFHVVRLANEIRLQLADGRIANPQLIGVDAETDLALLKVDLGPLPAMPLGRSDQLRIGDIVLAIGNPYGLTKTVTQGIVSATGRGVLGMLTFENFIQTDAAINEGNSGGALINTNGQLVGINTAVLMQDASTEGIGFAIPVDLVRGVVDEIKKNGRVIRGWVGIVPDELTRVEAEALGINSNTGILLNTIVPNSPAEAAGLRQGDVILSINGETIRSRQQALLIVARLNPEDQVEMEGFRDGQRFRVSLIAAERPPTQSR
ncbi:MAG: trypsin-like peptidase domain-containing protein [Woeseiaceae bacterium]|jgi:serine peptidase DegS|nr:trypsin-like peptidase domain-containing protein [Woeseiaceae bacterium]